MRKITAFTLFIIILALAAGCGQSDFANVNVKSSRIEFVDPDYDTTEGYLVLKMEIENLTDSVLYIESSSPTNEEGEKHLWFVIKDEDGNEHKATYYKEIESNIFPMSVSPRTTTEGELAFMVTTDVSSVTLEVTQNVVGEGGSKVIYTQEIPI